MSVHTIQLPWDKPPLNANQRMHWTTRARHTKTIRGATYFLALDAKLPTGQSHVAVALHYQPRDNRRRDADNLVPTLKACCDGLVDAYLVADDTPDLMTKLMPVIHPAVKGEPARMWLNIATDSKDTTE